MPIMATTEEICQAINHTPEALAWQVEVGHLTGPDSGGLWDLHRVHRENKAYTRRSRSPRAYIPVTAADVAAAEADERRTNMVVTEQVSDDTTEVRDGHGRYVGSVVRGHVLTGETVWFIRPLSREAHANLWELPSRDDRRAAVRALFSGSYVL